MIVTVTQCGGVSASSTLRVSHTQCPSGYFLLSGICTQCAAGARNRFVLLHSSRQNRCRQIRGHQQFVQSWLRCVPVRSFPAQQRAELLLGLHSRPVPSQLAGMMLRRVRCSHSSVQQTSCTNCTAGRYSVAAAASTCLLVGVRFPTFRAHSLMRQCAPGTFGALPGATQCHVCNHGEFTVRKRSSSSSADLTALQRESGASACHLCAAGSFSALPGQTACQVHLSRAFVRFQRLRSAAVRCRQLRVNERFLSLPDLRARHLQLDRSESRRECVHRLQSRPLQSERRAILVRLFNSGFLT